jgi:nucleotide-binding universal stress UspA family protein
MFTRILVPTDFGPASDAALTYARSLATIFGSTVHVLHVMENVFLRPMVSDPHDVKAMALRTLEDRISGIDAHGVRFVPVLECSDEPADEIVSYARIQDIDLIVMGTHGRTGVAHFLMGSVAERVVQIASCPVLTLHGLPQAAGRPHLGIRRILVPTDFSEPSDSALGRARILARHLDASIHLLHVLDEATVPGSLGSEVFVTDTATARMARLNDARERLAHRINDDDRKRFRATFEVIFGTGARTITDYAADNQYDLIVMGTHGRKGIGHLIMGSVAEAVVRTATCPVMTTHTAGASEHARDINPVPARVTA